MIYSEEFKNKVRETYKTGISIMDIGPMFNCGKSSVHRWCIDLIRRSNRTEFIEKARAEYLLGKTCKEIGLQLNLSRATINTWVKDIIRTNSESKRGKYNGSWKGGITSLNEKIRKSDKYLEWRIAVFERDNFTCQFCGQVGGKLHADHIMPFSIFDKVRFDLLNGRTLCEKCHKETETFGWKGYRAMKLILERI